MADLWFRRPSLPELQAELAALRAQHDEVRRVLDLWQGGFAGPAGADLAGRIVRLVAEHRTEREQLLAQIEALGARLAAQPSAAGDTHGLATALHHAVISLYDYEDQLEYCRRTHGSNGRLHDRRALTARVALRGPR